MRFLSSFAKNTREELSGFSCNFPPRLFRAKYSSKYEFVYELAQLVLTGYRICVSPGFYLFHCSSNTRYFETESYREQSMKKEKLYPKWFCRRSFYFRADSTKIVALCVFTFWRVFTVDVVLPDTRGCYQATSSLLNKHILTVSLFFRYSLNDDIFDHSKS